MSSIFQNTPLGLLLFAALCMFTLDEARGRIVSDPQIREKRTVGRSRSRQGPNRSQLTDVLQRFSADGSFLGGDLSMYTPTTPRPEDVNCHVEIPTTTLVGGRCVNIGSQSFVCQAGAYLAFTTECQNAGTDRHRRSSGNVPRRSSAFQMVNSQGYGGH